MKANAGFTLIEVLIAMVVLAIGLLGLAALQTTSLRNNQSAYFRSQATQLAYDIADRVRINTNSSDPTTYDNYNNKTGTADDCVTNTCTPAEMAGYDLSQWNAQLALQLPSGVGFICIDSTPDDGASTAGNCDSTGSAYAVKIFWDDGREGQANQMFTMSFQP
jgi:type IV pilus assembly protein PilV